MLTYKQRKRAKKLRNYSTKEENKLWYIYLCKYPLKIRRQHPIGNYIVDFFCKETKLVIEVDGIQHLLENKIKDNKLQIQITFVMELQLFSFVIF